MTMSDLIRRKDAIEAMKNLEAEDNETYGCNIPECFDSNRAIEALNKLSSAEQEEFEWCHDCKEYDQEKHCCHRWTKVIRQTVEELKATERTAEVFMDLRCVNGIAYQQYICSACDKSLNIPEVGKSPDWKPKYCHHCGARLEWK